MSWRGWTAFASLGIIWGVPYFFIKLALQEISPVVIAFCRVSLAAAILLPIAWRRGALRSLGSHRGAICAFAMVEFVIPFIAISVGERWISSSAAGILIAMVPLSVAVMQRFFGVHEPLSAGRSVGLAIGLVGVAALLRFGTISGALGWAGAACVLLATLGYATGPLIIQRHLAGLDPAGPLAASLAVAAVALLLPAISMFPTHMPSAQVLGSLAMLGVVCTAVAMLLLFYLIGHAGASRG